MIVNGGYISNLLVEVARFDVAEVLRVLATRDVQVRLRCAVADLNLKQGVVTPQALVIDTTDTVVTASGTVNFRSATLDLVTKPVPKDPSPFVLRSPLLVRGTLKKPDVKPQLGPCSRAAQPLVALGR
jgi:AsmA family protein